VEELRRQHAFGGTCLNAGCIPSKALLESSELYHRAQSEFGAHGIKVGGLEFDLATMQKRKAKIVKASTQGITALFKAAGVTGLQGHGKLLAGNRVEYTALDGTKQELPRSTSCSRAARCRCRSSPCRSTARRSSTPGARSSSTPCRSASA
jgi:pyruvate/2-oxoglutarate dehydrogenase complex dihydrolipoamide dehydrogenase (E3) component